MKKKNIIIIVGVIIVVITVILIISHFFGAPATSQKDPLDLIQKNEMVEIEIADPEDTQQGTRKPLDWTILAELTTYQDTLRTPFEKAFYVRIDNKTGEKIGRPYFNAKNETVQNNTLVDACQNILFLQTLIKKETVGALSNAALATYTDLDADDVLTNFYLAINGYFNLLPDAEPNYCNPSSTLTRAEFLALLTRASTPVTELTVNADFEKLVGKSEYNIYAQESEKFGYLNTSDSSINEKTYTGTISKAEVIYALISKYFPNELANADLTDIEKLISLPDVKNGGDIAEEQGFAGKTYGKSYELVWAINNPDEGLPTPLYRAIMIAADHGIIDRKSETNWDSGVTKAEAIELLIHTVSKNIETKSDVEDSIPDQDNNSEMDDSLGWVENPVHPAYRSEYGTFDIGLDEAGLTREEDLEDGWLGFTQVIHEDGTSHLVCNLDNSIYYHGELLPSGSTYSGTEKDRELALKEAADALKGAKDYLEKLEQDTEEHN